MDRKRREFLNVFRGAARAAIRGALEPDDPAGGLKGARDWVEREGLDDEAHHLLVASLFLSRGAGRPAPWRCDRLAAVFGTPGRTRPGGNRRIWREKIQMMPVAPRRLLLRMLLCAALVVPVACADAGPPDHADGVSDSPMVIRGVPTCSDCEIGFDTLAVLGATSDPSSIRPDAMAAGCMVSHSNDGVSRVSGLVGGGQLLEYRGSGGSTRTLGRMGEGPGEFGRNLRIVEVHDTLFIVDLTNGRMAVADRDARFHRVWSLPVRIHSLAPLPEGRWLLHGRPRSEEDGSPLFRIVDGEGREEHSFGTVSPTHGEMDQWVVGPDGTGGFWAASMWEYALHRGSTDGELRKVLSREVEWFPEGTTWSEDQLTVDPAPPLVTHVMAFEGGTRVGVVITLADERWSPDMPESAGSVEWFRRSFDSVLEVLDLEAGTVVASVRSDDWLAPICGTDLLYTVVPGPDGDTRAVVLRPRLMGEGDR